MLLLLLEEGSDPTIKTPGGFTALHFAAQSGNVEYHLVAALLAAGADASARTKVKVAAMHLVAQFGDDPMVLVLLKEHGAPMGIRNFKGKTPVHYAATRHNPKFLETLLSMGAPFPTECKEEKWYGARFFEWNLHSRMPLSFMPLLRLKCCHACDQWHSSRVFTSLTSWHCKLRPNTEGRHGGMQRTRQGTRTAEQ
jgi:hypothetical protein